MDRSRCKIYSFKPPCLEPSRGGKRTKSLWRYKTLLKLLALIVIAMLVSMLSGCASSMRIEGEKPLPLSAEMSAPQSPDVKAYSKRVSDYLAKAQAYFAETPTFMTQ